MDKLIEILQILKKYNNSDSFKTDYSSPNPLCDSLSQFGNERTMAISLHIDFNNISDEDINRLEELGFIINNENNNLMKLIFINVFGE
jgi:hypothetical protein